jgi:hypothetical protein
MPSTVVITAPPPVASTAPTATRAPVTAPPRQVVPRTGFGDPEDRRALGIGLAASGGLLLAATVVWPGLRRGKARA